MSSKSWTLPAKPVSAPASSCVPATSPPIRAGIRRTDPSPGWRRACFALCVAATMIASTGESRSAYLSRSFPCSSARGKPMQSDVLAREVPLQLDGISFRGYKAFPGGDIEDDDLQRLTLAPLTLV